MDKIIQEANEDGKWLAKSCGCKTAGYAEVTEKVRRFFDNWEQVNPVLYNKSIKSTKRMRKARGAAAHAAKVYRDYSRFGLRAGKVFEDDEEVTFWSNAIAEHAPNFKRECVDELRHVEQILAPSFVTKR